MICILLNEANIVKHFKLVHNISGATKRSKTQNISNG